MATDRPAPQPAPPSDDDKSVAGEEDPGAALDADDAPGNEVPPGAAGSGEPLCRRCGGSGRVDNGAACPACGATGKVTRGICGG